MGAAALGLGTLAYYGSGYSVEELKTRAPYNPKDIRVIYAHIGGTFISAALVLAVVLRSPTPTNLFERNQSLLICGSGVGLYGLMVSKIRYECSFKTGFRII